MSFPGLEPVAGMEAGTSITVTAGGVTEVVGLTPDDSDSSLYTAAITPTRAIPYTWRFIANDSAVFPMDQTFICDQNGSGNSSGQYACPTDSSGYSFPDKLPNLIELGTNVTAALQLANQAIANAANATAIAQQALTLAQSSKNGSFTMFSSINVIILAFLAILYLR